jgi:dipeptidase E
MKRLLLASSGQFICEHSIDPYLPKKLIESSIAYIITASKKVPDKAYIDRHMNAMDRLKFNYTIIDIEGKDETALTEELSRHDIIYVEGGNTFFLLKCARESGLEHATRLLLQKGKTYIGSSAGSYIACPSIITATWSNRNFDRCGITDYTGMNLVPFLIKAHYTLDQEGLLKEKKKALNYPLWALTDDQALLVEDLNIRLLGKGKKVIF